MKTWGLSDVKQTSQRWSDEIQLTGSSVEGEEIPSTTSQAVERQPQVFLHPTNEVIQRKECLPPTFGFSSIHCDANPGISATSGAVIPYSEIFNFFMGSSTLYTHSWECSGSVGSYV